MVRRSTTTERTLLVVDDNPTLLGAYEREFRRRYRVVTASDSARAKQLALEHHPDIAIVDLLLGDHSGIVLIRELKAIDPEMYIVLVTGVGSMEIAVRAMRAGASDVVAKPVRGAELIRRLEDDDGADSDRVPETPTLAMAEWEHLQRVLAECNGNVSMAARKLGIYRSSLQRRLKKPPEASSQ
jgi:two-component system response regulator RegA